MATFKNDEIGEADLLEYVENESDFAFEVRVVKELSKHGLLEHGGTYIDPHTQKPRQFDIRMRIPREYSVVRFAVECKNIKRSYPMIATCLPRTQDEALTTVIWSLDKERRTFHGTPRDSFSMKASTQTAHCISFGESMGGIYRTGQPVGKTITQVGRNKEGRLVWGDDDLYTKWAQALSSADDLVHECADDGSSSRHGFCFSSVFPVLVVPEGTLWSCEFDSSGNRASGPKCVDRLQLYVGKECWVRSDGIGGQEKYTLTHLEVVTLVGFDALMKDVLRSPTLIQHARAAELEKTLGPGFGYH